METIILIATVIALLVSAPDRDKTIAYSWSEVDSTIDNIVPFHWLRKKDLLDRQEMLRRAKAATDQMPKGHRALFSWDLHRDMAWHPQDTLTDEDGNILGCKDTNGGFKKYHSLWWDHGVEQMRSRLNQWFEDYARIGGKVDTFVLDFEQGFSYWHLLSLGQHQYTDCGIEGYLQAIERDPRFVQLSKQLGFADLGLLNEWYRNDKYLSWGAIMNKRMADYINSAVYEPIRKHFPKVNFSNYGYSYTKSNYRIPDLNGHDHNRYTDGRHVGTHQSRALYGWMGNLRNQALDGVHIYAATPFNAFRYEINKLRANKLSSSIPIAPWIANKEFENSELRESDYYQELIFHIALSGIDYYLFWNPKSTSSPATAESNRLLSDLMHRVDEVFAQRQQGETLNSLVPWNMGHVLTEAVAGKCRIWRFTPQLENDEEITDIILNRNPAEFQLDGSVLSIADGRIVEFAPRLSNKGVWILSHACAKQAN